MNTQVPLSEPPNSSPLTRQSRTCVSSMQVGPYEQPKLEKNRDIVIPDSEDEVSEGADDYKARPVLSNARKGKLPSEVCSPADCNTGKIAKNGNRKAGIKSRFVETQQEKLCSQYLKKVDISPELFVHLTNKLVELHEALGFRQNENTIIKGKLNTRRQTCFELEKKIRELEKENYKIRNEKYKERKRNTKLRERIAKLKEKDRERRKKNRELSKENRELSKKTDKLEQDRDENRKMYLLSERKNVNLEELCLQADAQSQENYLSKLLYLKSLMKPTSHNVGRR